MQSADTDNSGTIDYGEFLAAMLHENKLQEKDHLYTAFTYIDKDGSGYITRDELQQAFLQFGQLDIQLDDIIHEVDKDNVINIFLSKGFIYSLGYLLIESDEY
ncbi:hypothetical protein K1719_000315 [Acacia pycnantha]|nr:hypothetical protein K1719_000315 [Acacia pycnantha]